MTFNNRRAPLALLNSIRASPLAVVVTIAGTSFGRIGTALVECELDVGAVGLLDPLKDRPASQFALRMLDVPPFGSNRSSRLKSTGWHQFRGALPGRFREMYCRLAQRQTKMRS